MKNKFPSNRAEAPVSRLCHPAGEATTHGRTTQLSSSTVYSTHDKSHPHRWLFVRKLIGASGFEPPTSRFQNSHISLASLALNGT